ncbi:MAG: signal peptide peptidase SppA [Deltaproteobacteria bacterium]|nr:signal peptide peptidase SppA [Deltaproteobacteria bacterium]
MKRTLLIITCIMFLLAEGCAYVSIPLTSPVRPLEEIKLEGKGRDRILLIDISGAISSEKRRSLVGRDNEPASPVARLKEELEKASADNRIKAVILKINSPGGTVTACDIMYREILRFKKKKNVFVAACLMDIAASGGYYIANAADIIIAHPTTVTGSIGVIALKFNIKGLMEKIGVEEESIKSGDKKDIFSYWRGITEEERKIMQEIIDSMYGQFLAAIDQGRKNLSLDEIKPLADGRIYTAQQALDHKLIDGIGYLDDVINMSKKTAGIEKARVITYHRPSVYKSNIYSQATINIFGLGENNMLEYLPVQFLYLWNP